MSFEWHPNEPPPHIEAHSKAKLEVLRSYLREYFNRLNVNRQREEFKLDLIDGFSGGGTFLDGDAVLSGTPLVMLEETAAARTRLNVDSQIQDLIRYRDGDGGRALVQRTLRDHARSITGAMYDTPFFIRPRGSRRALWFLHLSRHPTARDVMIQRHWDLHNTFEHYGRGDLGMLGWDTLKDSETLPLFRFGELDQRQMQKQLLESLPKELFGLVSEQPVTLDALRHMLANRTAARFSDLDQTIVRLVEEREFEILDPDGKVRSRSLKRLSPTDRVALPSTLWLPGFSRRS